MHAVKMALLSGVAALALMGPTIGQEAPRPAPMSTATAADLIPHAVIRRDTFGVPHITADTDEAVAFAMGYAVAEDHAVEMGKMYLQARGDAARWFGAEHLESDLAMKRMDNLEGARRALERTGDGYRRWLHGFVTGVNFYAARHRAELPEWFPTVTEADIIAFSRRGAAEAAVRAQGADGEGEGDDGSNALAIAGTHSSTGKPILLGNPHLRWTAQYWEAHITVPGKINFYGSLTVGLAVLRAGFGENIGYVQTNNNVDLVDHYAVPLASGRPDHYVFGGKTQPFQRQTVRVEVLQPGGRVQTVEREYEATEFGPVVSRNATHAVVSRSHGADAWHFHEGYYDLYFAQNFDSFMKVLSRQLIPSSNFTYADGDGNIQYLWNSALPRRPVTVSDAGDVKYTGIVPGDDDRYFWKGIVPLAEAPRFLNPASGYVQNANNPPWFGTVRERLDPAKFPPYMEQGAPGLRPQMALTLLEAKQKWSSDDIIKLKYTTTMLMPRRVLPDLFAAGAAVKSPSPDVRTGLRILRSWDQRAAARSRGAVLFQNFWTIYSKNATPLYREEWSNERVIETPTGLGNPEAALAALEAAVALVRERHGRPDAAWGDVNRYQFPGIDLPGNGGPQGLGLYTAQNYDPPEEAGAPVVTPVVNTAGRPDYGAPASGGGDGWIMLVDFTKPVRVQGVLAYGQSGNADSPHSRDQIKIFAEQKLRPLWFTDTEIKANLEREYRPGAPKDELTRTDRFVDSDGGVRIAVREVVGKDASGTPILLVHDAGAGGLVSFDLPNASVAAEFARAGHPVTIMSVRGWEKSTRPASLEQAASESAPAASLDEARRDIDAVVSDLRARRGQAKVALIGWGAGSTWSLAYAGRHPDGLSHLVLLNPARTPDAETCKAATGAYQAVDARTLRKRWDASMPEKNAGAWRDELVAAAFVQRALRLDPSSDLRTPASVRIPNGPLAESCSGKALWDIARVTTPTLIVHGDSPDIGRVHMPSAITVIIKGATHYLLLDKPERGRKQFMTTALAFLKGR